MIDQNMTELICEVFGRRHVVHVQSVLGGGWEWTCFDCELTCLGYASLEVCEGDADGHAADPSGHPMHRLDGGPR